MIAAFRQKLAGFFFILAVLCGFALAADGPKSEQKPCMVETSAWMLYNLMPDSPDFYQLYLQAQLGYQIDLFGGRLFLKPAIYANYWPVNTNFPDSFSQKEKDWPNYQPFEPHLSSNQFARRFK